MGLNCCRICGKCLKGLYLESVCALQKAWCLQQHLHPSSSHLVASLCWLTSSQSTIHSGLKVCLANKLFFSPGCSVLLRTRSCSAFVVFFVLYRFIRTGDVQRQRSQSVLSSLSLWYFRTLLLGLPFLLLFSQHDVTVSVLWYCKV